MDFFNSPLLTDLMDQILTGYFPPGLLFEENEIKFNSSISKMWEEYDRLPSLYCTEYKNKLYGLGEHRINQEIQQLFVSHSNEIYRNASLDLHLELEVYEERICLCIEGAENVISEVHTNFLDAIKDIEEFSMRLKKLTVQHSSDLMTKIIGHTHQTKNNANKIKRNLKNTKREIIELLEALNYQSISETEDKINQHLTRKRPVLEIMVDIKTDPSFMKTLSIIGCVVPNNLVKKVCTTKISLSASKKENLFCPCPISEEILLNNVPENFVQIERNRNSKVLRSSTPVDAVLASTVISGRENSLLELTLADNKMQNKLNHPYLPSLVLGTYGSCEGQFWRPWGICSSSTGNIIVSDCGNHRLQIFDKNGTFIKSFGEFGKNPGQFCTPMGLAVTHDDHIVVADSSNHRIQVFTIEGTYLRSFGKYGGKKGQFKYPWGVTCDSSGNIIVVDSKNCRIQKFNQSGRFLDLFSFPVKPTESVLRGICVTPSNEFIIADYKMNCLLIVDGKFSNYRVLNLSYAEESLSGPQGVVCDKNGVIVVADSKNHRLKAMDLSGNPIWTMGERGSAPHCLNKPSGLCLTSKGYLAVVDFGNSCCKIW